jgi:hypothetical protein
VKLFGQDIANVERNPGIQALPVEVKIEWASLWGNLIGIEGDQTEVSGDFQRGLDEEAFADLICISVHWKAADG